MRHKCLTYSCEEVGADNLELTGAWLLARNFPAFACKKHTKKEIQLSKDMGFSVKELYKQEPEHICSLILCKNCLKDVKKHLSY